MYFTKVTPARRNTTFFVNGSMVYQEGVDEIKRSSTSNIAKDIVKVHTKEELVVPTQIMNLKKVNTSNSFASYIHNNKHLENKQIKIKPDIKYKVTTSTTVSNINENIKHTKPVLSLSDKELESFVRSKIKEEMGNLKIEKVVSNMISSSICDLKKQMKILKNEDTTSREQYMKGEINKLKQNIDTEIKSSATKNIDIIMKECEIMFQNKFDSIKKSQSVSSNNIEQKYKPLEDKFNKFEETIPKQITATIEDFIENYFKKIKDIEENVDLDECDDSEPQTDFESTIQPAVARIISRVMKFDQGDTDNITMSFKEEDQELSYDVVHSENVENVKYNPLYDIKCDIRHDASENVEMDTVYNKKDVVGMQENELRSRSRLMHKWIRLGNGIDNGMITDICMDNTNNRIYVTGCFKHVNHIPVNNIAMYDLQNKMWSALDNGVPNMASSVVIYEKKQILFVGGIFNKVGLNNIEASNIAAYYIEQKKWVSLGDGLNRDCSCLLFDEKTEKLYAAGSFTSSGNLKIPYVGVYDLKTNKWDELPSLNLNGPCRTLFKLDNDLYVGGLFTHAGKSDHYVSYIAKYNLTTFELTELQGGLQGYCNSITHNPQKNVLYVGGTFNSCGSHDNTINANHIAEYNISKNQWANMNGGLDNIVNSLYFNKYNNTLYVGGEFIKIHKTNEMVNHIAKYENEKWFALENKFSHEKDENDSDNVGTNGYCKVISLDEKSLFIAGKFQIAGNITANSIVRYILKR